MNRCSLAAKEDIALASTSLTLRQQTAERAYYLWRERGCVHGNDLSDWFDAERDLVASLRIGVLIIGSLLWDDEQGRLAWRKDQLRLDEAVAVRVPIRYGRKAKGRNDTYTMVLSRKAPLGTAQVIPCQGKGSELFEQAIHLWCAESGEQATREISATWGCVALLARENRVPQQQLEKWALQVSSKSIYKTLRHAHDEEELVSSSGLLLIDWPKRVDNDEPVDLDVLLATTNEPELLGDPPDYPKANDIATAWLQNGHEYYFRNNRERGIHTFEDEQILQLLKNKVQVD